MATIEEVYADFFDAVGEDPLFDRLHRPESVGGSDGSGIGARATWKMRRSSIPHFVRAISGRVESFGGDVGGTQSIKVPLEWPDWSGEPKLYAQRWSFRYVGGKAATEDDPAPAPQVGENATAAYAEVTVDFHTPTWDYTASAWTSKQLRLSANAVTVPGIPYRFKAGFPSALKPLNQDVAIFVPEIEVRYTRHWLPSLAYIETRAQSLIQRVNSVAIGVYPAGTLMFAGLNTLNVRSAFGDLQNEADLSFIYHPRGWNYILSEYSGQWERLERSNDGGDVYESADLNQLLTL